MTSEFKKMKEEIEMFYNSERYYEVIMIGLQLAVIMAADIMETMYFSSNESIKEEVENNAEIKAISSIIDIYYRNLKNVKEATKAIIQQPFYEYVQSEAFEKYSKEEVTRIMRRIEKVVNYRNKLAHEYYDKPNLKNQLSLKANECMELIQDLEKHPWA